MGEGGVEGKSRGEEWNERVINEEKVIKTNDPCKRVFSVFNNNKVKKIITKIK